MNSQANYSEKFTHYFSRPVAQKAADSLRSNAILLFQINCSPTERFLFSHCNGQNEVRPLAPEASVPPVDFVFTLPTKAADQILNFDSEDIGQIGVFIGKLMLSGPVKDRIRVQCTTGVLSLASKGYLGVIKSGGSVFFSFLTQYGLGGFGAIKKALAKLKG